MKRKLATLPLLAAVLTLAACASSTPPAAPAPAPAAATQSAPPSPTPPVYDNTTACTAFTAATTTGIPASADVPVGTSTVQWLATQETGATPALQAQLGKFIAAWGDTPPDTAAIRKAARRIRRICAGA
jgi:hypothetical protein